MYKIDNYYIPVIFAAEISLINLLLNNKILYNI